MENDLSRRTGSPMPQPISSLLPSALTSTPASENFSTGSNPSVPCMPTGKPLSATVLDGLRNLAASANRGELVSDEKLQESLTQAFGSRIAIKKSWRRVYDKDGGYDEVPDGFRVRLDVLNDTEMKVFDALDFFNRPIQSEQVQAVTGMLTRMRVSMLRRNENEDDIEMLIDTAMSVCIKYPFDVVMSLTEQWLTTRKFFPLPCEMKEELDDAVALRRSLLACFERTRQTTLAPSAKNLSLPRKKDRHDLPREKWTPQDWDAHIADAENMLNLARQNPTMFKVEDWHEEVSRRMGQKSAALGDKNAEKI